MILTISLQVLSIGAAICGLVYQIKAGKTYSWKKQNLATMAWATAYVLIVLSKFIPPVS